MLSVVVPACPVAHAEDIDPAGDRVRFEEVLVGDIAEPKRPGEVWVGAKPRLRRNAASFTELPLTLETGVVRDLGIEIVLPYLIESDARTATGLGDLRVSLKYDLLGEAHPDCALTLGVGAAFPTGRAREGFSDLAYQMGPLAILSIRRGRLEMHLALEASFPVATRPVRGVEAEEHGEAGGDLAAHYRLHDGVGLIGEITSERAFGDGPFTRSVVGGVWLEPVERVEIGLGVDVPFGPGREGDWGLVSALWLRF